MNDKGKELIARLSIDEPTALESRIQLVTTRSLGVLCHHSSDIQIDFIRYMSVNNISFSENGHYFVLLISNTSLSYANETNETIASSYAYSYSIIKDAVAQIFTGRCMFYSCEMDGRLAVILCFLHGISEVDKNGHMESCVKDDCKKIAAICQSEYGLSITLFLSSLFEGIHMISSEYRRLLDYDIYQHYLDIESPNMLMQLPAPAMKTEFIHYLHSSATELTGFILNFGDATNYLHEIMERIAFEEVISITELTTHIFHFIDDLCKAFSDYGVPVDIDYINRTFPLILNNSQHWSDVVQWFEDLVGDAAIRYNRRCQSSGFQRFADIKTYVDANYGNPDLSVSFLADHFNINQTFLSTTFKKQYKTTLSNYIQTERLAHAKKLLTESPQPIGDIVRLSGFGSPETFYRVFKKTYGLSPKQIRTMSLS